LGYLLGPGRIADSSPRYRKDPSSMLGYCLAQREFILLAYPPGQLLIREIGRGLGGSGLGHHGHG
jgi:hypothetical protein